MGGKVMKWILNILNALADWMIVNRAEKVFWDKIKVASDLSNDWSRLGQAMDLCWEAGEMVTSIAWVVTDKKQERRLWDLYQDSYEMHTDLKTGLYGKPEDWNYNEEECPF
jgi:hypothetical protein